MNTSIATRVIKKINHLPYDLQRKVLEFVDSLDVSSQQGIPGRQLLRFAGAIPLNDLQSMRLAIESGCEQIDQNEW